MTLGHVPRTVGSTSRQPSVRLWLEPDATAVPIVRAAVGRVCAFDDDESESSFMVALTEITTNAVDEHARLGLQDPVVVELCLGNEPQVSVRDSGEGLDRDRASDDSHEDLLPPPEVETGRGIIVARAFVPELRYETGAHGTKAILPLRGFGGARTE